AGERVEHFYLEDPNIPKKALPVQVYGVFDRVTINDSTARRLQDDSIKMLGRTEKCGVMLQDPVSTKATKITKKKAVDTYRFILLHGHTGRPDKNWFSWLKQELEKY